MAENLLEAPEEDIPQIDPNKDYVAELVGPDKKFKTIQDLARGKYESDILIPIQNRRMDDMRTDYLRERELNMSRAKLEEIVDQLSKKQLASNENTQVNEAPTEKPQINPKDIEDIISRKLKESDLSKRQEENYNIVRNKLKERFGNNYANVLKTQVEDLRLSDEDVNALARKSPDAFFRLMGLDLKEQKDSYQAPPKSSQRSDSFAPKVEKRTWSYYQNMRKNDPTLYYNPKTNDQMVKDAKTLGKEFEDGDYNTI